MSIDVKTRFSLAFLALLCLIGSTQAINIVDCSNLDVANTYYTLTSDILNSPWNICMNVTAANVTLDCGGLHIGGPFGMTYMGVFVNSSNNFTMKNCVVQDWGIGVYVNASNNTNISYSNITGNSPWQMKFYNTFNDNIQDNLVCGGKGLYSSFGKNQIFFGTVAGANQDNDKIYIRRNHFANGSSGIGSGSGIEFDCFPDESACNAHQHEIVIEYNNFTGWVGRSYAYQIWFVNNYSNATIQFNKFYENNANTIIIQANNGFAIKIYNNTFSRATPTATSNQFIIVYSSRVVADVENNAFYGNWAGSIQSLDYVGDGQDHGFVNSTFFNNTFYGGGFYGALVNSVWDCNGKPMDFTFSAGGGGSYLYIAVSSGASYVYNNTVKNCNISNSEGQNVIYVGKSLTLYNNTLASAAGNENLYVIGQDGGTGMNISNNVMHDAGGSAIHFELTNGVLVFNNTLYNTASEGVFLSGAYGGVDLTGANVSYNLIHDVLDSCIYGDVKNSFYQNNVCFNSGLEGLWVSTAYSTEDNNTIIFNTQWNSTAGIAGRLEGSNVSYNTLFNNTRGGPSGTQGIGIQASSDNMIIVGNTIFNNTGAGIAITGGSNNKLYSNNVSYNLVDFYSDCRFIFGLCGTYSYGNEVVDSLLDTNSSGELSVYLDHHSQLTFVNTTFNKSSVSFGSGALLGPGGAVSNLTVKWYVTVNVTDNVSLPISGATVRIYDNTGLLVASGITNALGLTSTFNITEYFQNITGIYNYTPHLANASEFYHYPNATTAFITQSMTIQISLTPWYYHGIHLPAGGVDYRFYLFILAITIAFLAIAFKTNSIVAGIAGATLSLLIALLLIGSGLSIPTQFPVNQSNNATSNATAFILTSYNQTTFYYNQTGNFTNMTITIKLCEGSNITALNQQNENLDYYYVRVNKEFEMAAALILFLASFYIYYKVFAEFIRKDEGY